MLTVWIGAIGLMAFWGGATVLGVRLRRGASKAVAEHSSRVMHFLFFAGLGFPVVLATLVPGLSGLDPLVGLDPLPAPLLRLVVALGLAVPGIYLLRGSVRLLRERGEGENAFRLTKRVVASDLYRRTRNPMSLGYYLSSLALALLVGSSLLTLYVVVGLIPALLFFLRFFEERELVLRFGESYVQYKQRVPFLIPR